MDASTLIWWVIFGSIGLGYFVYGKKQRAVIPLFSGIGLLRSTLIAGHQTSIERREDLWPVIE
ncbi:MAG: hypothetical protein KJ630_21590 [Proteobacteria bacterium]|nr:hypothetical protein [Pseudomonadota bacterium]